MENHDNKIGVWLIGARGQVALITAIGLYALQKKLTSETGMVTGLPEFQGISFGKWEDFVLGGTDIRTESLVRQAKSLCWTTREIHPGLLVSLQRELELLDKEITIGTALNCGETIESFAARENGEDLSLMSVVDRLREQLASFRAENRLEHIVVVNLASTEPPPSGKLLHFNRNELMEAIKQDDRQVVRSSTLYTCAALLEECAYINFTPSQAALPPAMIEFAESQGVPVMGSDGKTGETLIKSVLAPMFVMRNLKVLSWEGFNILGNRDGRVLKSPENKKSKIQSKDHLLPKILGYKPHSSVHINFVPSLDDQKTAWDFIHFEGFLETKMSLQFIWQGFDSVLAAPLVLDLIRMTGKALERGETGIMPHLSCFFKSPLGENRHDLTGQFESLMRYVQQVSE